MCENIRYFCAEPFVPFLSSICILRKTMKMESKSSTRRSQYIIYKNDKFEKNKWRVLVRFTFNSKLENNIKVSEERIKSNFLPHWIVIQCKRYIHFELLSSQQVEGWPLFFDSLFLQNICCMSALIKGKWMSKKKKKEKIIAKTMWL